MNHEYAPPHSAQAEQSLLGGLLLQPEAFDKIAGKITTADFYQSQHRAIFTTILAMLETSDTVDVVTVAERMGDCGTLAQAGGMSYLVDLAQNTPSAAHIAQYAKTIRAKSIERGLLASSALIAELVHEACTTDEKLERAESMIMALAESKQQFAPRLLSDLLPDAVANLDRKFHADSHISGLTTGLTDFDDLTGGLQKSDLLIIAGRPSMGKTAIAMNIAEHVAQNGKTVAVFEMEMSGAQLADRMIASVGRIDSTRMRTGKLVGDDWDRLALAMSKLMPPKIVVDETPAISLLEMRASLRRTKREHGLDLIVVDYLQLMSGAGENRTQQVGSVSRGLKSIAKEFDVPVVALSQLSRKCDERADKRPVMSDLRESGDIEADADLIAFVYRDEVYDKQSLDKGTAELLIRKHRNGALAELRLAFLGEYTRFENLARDWTPPPQEQRKFRSRGADLD